MSSGGNMADRGSLSAGWPAQIGLISFQLLGGIPTVKGEMFA